MGIRSLDALMDEFVEPGLLLHRPFPAPRSFKSGSHFGGLPSLPDSISWPMGCNSSKSPDYPSEPLHFLAQIDCSIAGKLDRRLPNSGALFFFGMMDEEMVWDDCPGDRPTPWRVIYSADPLDERKRQPPSQLMPINGVYSGSNRHWLLENEAGPNSFPFAPIEFEAIRTWPDIDTLGDYVDRSSAEIRKAYAHRLSWRRATEYMLATEILPSSATPIARRDFDLLTCWLVVIMTCRIIIAKAQKERRRVNGATNDLDERVEIAKGWIAEGTAYGPESKIEFDKLSQFRNWLVAEGLTSIDATYPANVLQLGAISAAIHAIDWAVPTGSLPHQFLGEPVRPITFANDPRTLGGRATAFVKFHQMFGHVPSTQEPKAADGEICLLHLFSDYALEFMFWDVGELQFWIKPHDLASRQFDRVRATLAGG